MAKRRDIKRLDLCKKIQEEVGRRIRAAREGKGFLQKNLGRRLGLSRTTISNMERGTQRLYIDQLFLASQVLQIDVVALLPSTSDIFATPALAIRTALDDPLSEGAVEDAQRIVRDVLAQHGEPSLRKASVPKPSRRR